MAAGHSQGHTQAAILKAWLYIDQGFIKARSSSRSGISLSKDARKHGTRRAVGHGRRVSPGWERRGAQLGEAAQDGDGTGSDGTGSTRDPIGHTGDTDGRLTWQPAQPTRLRRAPQM